MRPSPKVQTGTPWKCQKPYVLVCLNYQASGLRKRWNKKVQEIKRGYDTESFLSDFLGLVNEEKYWPMTQYFQVKHQKYVIHIDKKDNKIGNFSANLIKEFFMICTLCDEKHDLHECKSFKEKGLQEGSRFLFEQKLCYECFSLLYLLVTMQETVRNKENYVCRQERHQLRSKP